MNTTTVIFEEESTTPEISDTKIIYPNRPHASAFQVEEIESFTFLSHEENISYQEIDTKQPEPSVVEYEADTEKIQIKNISRGISISSATEEDGYRGDLNDLKKNDTKSNDQNGVAGTDKDISDGKDADGDKAVEDLFKRIQKQRSILEDIIEKEQDKKDEGRKNLNNSQANKAPANSDVSYMLALALCSIERHSFNMKLKLFRLVLIYCAFFPLNIIPSPMLHKNTQNTHNYMLFMLKSIVYAILVSRLYVLFLCFDAFVIYI